MKTLFDVFFFLSSEHLCKSWVFVVMTSNQWIGYAYKNKSRQISDYVGVLNFVKSEKAIVKRPGQPRANY